MKYIMNEKEYDTAAEVAQEIIDNMDEQTYDEMLDECYPMIEFGSLKYYPSDALKRLDPIAYRCGMSDYYDSLYSDIKYDLERMSNGETNWFYGEEVEAVEDEEAA